MKIPTLYRVLSRFFKKSFYAHKNFIQCVWFVGVAPDHVFAIVVTVIIIKPLPVALNETHIYYGATYTFIVLDIVGNGYISFLTEQCS